MLARAAWRVRPSSGRNVLTLVSEANPTNQVMRADLAWITTLLGNRLVSDGRNDEALATYERALAEREKLAKANPTTTRYVEQQIGISRTIALLHERAGRPTDALASYQRARTIGENAAESVASPRKSLRN